MSRKKSKKDESNSGEKERNEIIIKVIDTPHGPVPHAESLVKLVKAWNETLIEMNSIISNIFSSINELKGDIQTLVARLNSLVDLMSDLSLKLTSFSRKIDALMELVDENSTEEKKEKIAKEIAKKELEDFI